MHTWILRLSGLLNDPETLVFGPTWSLSLVFWTLISRVLFLSNRGASLCLTFLSSVPVSCLLALSLRPRLLLVTRSVSQHVFPPFSWYLSTLGSDLSARPALEAPASLSEYGPASRFPNAVAHMRLNLRQKFSYLYHRPLSISWF